MKDLDRILEIEDASFGSEAFSRSTFKGLYRESPDLFIVAELSGDIVAYMVTNVYDNVAHVISLAVYPDYRRKGIGRELMQYTFDQLKESVKEVQLEVKVSNMEAIRFWAKLSFVNIGIIADYYNDGADALCMRKMLD